MLERLPRSIAIAFAALFLAASTWCFIAPGKGASAASAGQYTDMMLYRDIVTAIQAGKPYHLAATELQRAHGYPTQPFVTVREPALYLAAADLGWKSLQKLAALLLVGGVALWIVALPDSVTKLERFGVAAGIALGGASIAVPLLMGFTELWAGLLLSIALALRLRWPEKWWLQLIAIAAALTVRELALPYLLLAAAFALRQRRWTELAAWAALFAVFSLGMALHAQAVAAQVMPGDIVSPGWSGGQGLRGVLMALAYTSVWQVAWQPLALFACLLPALGWAALPGRGAPFALLLLGGYALMIALFARPDNFYWGFLLLPAWLGGYALVPRGIMQLWRAVSSR